MRKVATKIREERKKILRHKKRDGDWRQSLLNGGKSLNDLRKIKKQSDEKGGAGESMEEGNILSISSS